MSRTQDRGILLTGGLAIALTVAGLAVVEANTGPFDHELEHATHDIELTGTYTVEDGSASSPVCQNDPSGDVCSPETRIEATIDGLPPLADGSAYGAFLVDGDDILALGALEPGPDGHRLSFEGDVDADTYEYLRFSIVSDEDPSEQACVLRDQMLPTSGGDAMPIEDGFEVPPRTIEGEASLAQIGAVEVAITASATIDGLPPLQGWSYEAWLVDDEATWTSLGSLERGEDVHRLDARIERVTLADQDRFLVTIEPGEQAEPGGFPVVETPVEADSLWRR